MRESFSNASVNIYLRARLQERDLIDQAAELARASIAAGYYAAEAEVDAWIDSLGTNHPLPVPHPHQPHPL